MSCTESVLDRALLRGAGPVETTVIDEATVGGARHRKNPVTHDTDRLSEWEQDPSLRGHFVGRGPQKRTVGPAAPSKDVGADRPTSRITCVGSSPAGPITCAQVITCFILT
ncbi:hypothetical protein GW17_00009739 [Ensete ventricosum]|nr:hypothetical protein GW17_00009739 [Ensete ventricosum]